MKKIILYILTVFIAASSYCQNIFKATIADSSGNQSLAGATASIKGTNNKAIADKDGVILLKNIPNGLQTIIFSFIGFGKLEKTYTFPLNEDKLIVYLEVEEEEQAEVIVTSTRTSRTIANTPTRVEVIELEEIDEKSNMRPANISMLLHESTGIQVQQTSATTANASIRIQGLDGRYTQLLKDGFGSFGNFASGLSILEIPPLDLRQVEIIKGPASTLYGGGAIAGVVNFISKTPKEKAQYNFIINQSNIGQTNIGGFAMQRKEKIGYSLLALYNKQAAFDVDNDDFTELPKSIDFTIHPKLFLYPSEKATIILGNAFTSGERTGGDIFVIDGKADATHVYFEKNKTIRNTTTVEWIQQVNKDQRLTAKTSFSYFDRGIEVPNYRFQGVNYNSFTDVAYSINKAKQTLIIGANLVFDQFKEKAPSNIQSRDFYTNTVGVFVQHTWDINEKAKLESGIRTDYVKYGNELFNQTSLFVLPRISLVYQFNQQWSARIGGGLGYKSPTLFTELTETLLYKNIAALNSVNAEKSLGATLDINYRTKIGEDFNFSVNQLFFLTTINEVLVLRNNLTNYFFANSDKLVISSGFETNAKLIFKENYKLFVGYTYTNAKAEYQVGNQNIPLVPTHKLNLALIHEVEDKYKFGLEGYYTGSQYLYDGSQTPAYWEFGFMAEKIFSHFSIYINFENFTDQRQSRYKTVANPPHNNPSFDEIWNHLEGFVLNGGIKIKL
jgi:outer membrane receptor for ferrienterochelin and colicins